VTVSLKSVFLSLKKNEKKTKICTSAGSGERCQLPCEVHGPASGADAFMQTEKAIEWAFFTSDPKIGFPVE